MNKELEMTKDELAQFQKYMEILGKIQSQNNFKTMWCIYEIEDINENSGLIADYLTDGITDTIVELPNRDLTWLELWEYADKLNNLIGCSEHIFIESFELKSINGKRKLEVFFGS